ncbi:MAG: FkbM family methyltransferase [Acetobacteraceae bacterium]|nr:FkbM family methyltransferase [Acetobacteraceae bacterium]
MSASEQLKDLYSTLSLLTSSDEAAPRLAAIIADIAGALHPPGARSIGRLDAEDGTNFEVDLGDRLGRALYYGYQQEKIELSLFEQICPVGGQVWDVGANFGLYTVTSARRVGPSGKVHAFEPGSFARELLLRNLAANRVEDRVVVHDTALADRDGEGTFFEAEESAFSGLKDTGRAKIARQVQVRLARVDSIWQELGCPPIDAMKIDVEGLEAAVLEGASRAINGSPDLVLLVEIAAKNTNAEEKRRIVRRLTELGTLGFRFWQPCPVQGRIREYLPEDGSLPAGSENIFMVRRDSDREIELSKAATRIIAADSGLNDRERSLLSSVKVVLLQCMEAKRAVHVALQEKESALASLRAAHEAEIAALRTEIAQMREKLESALSLSSLEHEKLMTALGEAAHYREQLEATLARRVRKWLKRLRTRF